ncbi:MAG: ABC transporter substrate-binding protein [Candidatus Paceibacterota bacterium]
MLTSIQKTLKTFIRILLAFSKRERLIFGICVGALLISGFFIGTSIIQSVTIVVPDSGGDYSEGIVGQISYVNPILAKDGSSDKDLIALLFANTIDLAETIKNSTDFKKWNIRIKEGAVWHDNKPITSDDFVFTVETIQNPDTLSPLYPDWQHITISRVSEREIAFQLEQPYASFETVLAELRPIPKHIFESISPANMRLSKYNFEPIGSGPFSIVGSEVEDTGFVRSYEVQRNNLYTPIGHLAYLDTITLKFFEDEEGLIEAYNKGRIDGICTTNPTLKDAITLRTQEYAIPSMKYYAVFLNQNSSSLLRYPEVRKALAQALNKDTLIEEIFHGQATSMKGPLPDALTIEQRNNPTGSPESTLSQAGWKQNETTGIWEKGSISLSAILSIPNSEPLQTLAKKIVQQWQDVGMNITIDARDPKTLADEIIKTRNYQMLLFGNILLSHPDLFHFWDSSEKFYPGLNYSLYENKAVDGSITALKRIGIHDTRRTQYLENIASQINTDIPAIFLISPYYTYITKTSLEGIIQEAISLPDERFKNITDWHIKTKRVLK